MDIPKNSNKHTGNKRAGSEKTSKKLNFKKVRKIKLKLLRKFLPYKNGAPSRSTIARFLACFTPEKMEIILLVNVFDTKNGICLGQEKVEDKSNEITALPKLLEVLEIKGQIISSDAMNCHNGQN